MDSCRKTAMSLDDIFFNVSLESTNDSVTFEWHQHM